MKKEIIIPVVLVLVGGGVAIGLWTRKSGAAASYRTAKVERGDLVVTVSATGTIQPVTQVQVGTQVTGTVLKLLADFNSRVIAGKVVAQIDPALFQARVEQDKANLLQASAEVERVKANLLKAEKDLARSKE